VIHTDHQIFRHLKNQGKMNCRHVELVEFIETYSHVIKYKQNTKNIIANVLSQMYVILNTLNTRLLGFEYVKELYPDDTDFSDIYFQCELSATNGFF